MKKMNNYEMNILIDSLQSCLNWNGENLEEDFSKFISQEIPEVSKEEAEKILQDFLNLSPIERASINFDYYKFLSKYFN